jgi:hypothetical protein
MADTITAGAMQALSLRRRERWAQTPQTRTPTPEAAIPLIERLGVVTLYPLSPELPDLLHAYVGNDTERAVLPSWDSPMGDVYTWRWTLGRQSAAFYSAFLRGRPTWVSWALLPAVLRLRGELRTPDELYDARVISADAYRIAHVLDEASEPLPTGELRQRAGFPTGKPQRAAYLRAIAELETRLLLAKVFPADGEGENMHHALVANLYRQHIQQAEQLTREAAFDALLASYLPNAVYAVPKVLARQFGLPEAELRAALDRQVASGNAKPVTLPEQVGVCYLWIE